MRVRGPLLVLWLFALVAPSSAAAQAGISLLGLGRPDPPVDARLRALGGAGVVAHGRNLSLLNPASLARIETSSVLLSFATENRDVQGEARGDVRGTRFPVGQLVYPTGGRFVLALGFGAFLDQDWFVSFEDTLELQEDTVPFTENRTSDGGVSHLRGSVAFSASDVWHLGVGIDLYAGDVSRTVSRRFDDSAAVLNTYRDHTRWEYRGLGLTGGIVVIPDPAVRVGAAVSWSGDLEARNDSLGTTREFPMPLRAHGGASWRVLPEVTWLVAAGFATWSRTAEAVGGAEDTWSIGTGLEVPLARGETSRVTLRAGFRRATLPFTSGGAQAAESAWSAGAGGEFAGGLVHVDAAFDFGARGNVSDIGVRESFQRFSFSLSVSHR